MNILEVCLSPSFGGLEIHMRDFSRWLAAREGAKLHLAVLDNSRIDQSLRDLGSPTLRFTSPAGAFPLGKARRLAHFIDEAGIDVLHVHWKDDLPLAALAKRMARQRLRLVHTRQMSLPGRKFDPYHRMIYRSVDCFIAITRLIAVQAEKNLPIPPEKLCQIYYGVQVPELEAGRSAGIRRELGLEGKFVVGVIGRVTEPKGQHLLVEAIEILRSEGIPAVGLVVGEPFEKPYVERLTSMIRERKLAEHIRFMPFHPKPDEIMSACDVVALTTKAETFGLVLVEAMQCGVAVVGSNAEGVPEIIDDAKTGLLFEPWDAASLASALRRLFSDPALRRRLAEEGMRKARSNFAAGVQYEKFYAALRGDVSLALLEEHRLDP